MKKTKLLEIRTDTEWVERVRAAAERKGISVSKFIILAVNRYLNRY